MATTCELKAGLEQLTSASLAATRSSADVKISRSINRTRSTRSTRSLAYFVVCNKVGEQAGELRVRQATIAERNIRIHN